MFFDVRSCRYQEGRRLIQQGDWPTVAALISYMVRTSGREKTACGSVRTLMRPIFQRLSDFGGE